MGGGWVRAEQINFCRIYPYCSQCARMSPFTNAPMHLEKELSLDPCYRIPPLNINVKL